jgi:hypothetical protein
MSIKLTDLENYQDEPLWCIYGESKYWPCILTCKLITPGHNNSLNIWGYSVWKDTPGFRTLGIPVQEWNKRHKFIKYFDDQKEALKYLSKLITPKEPDEFQ